jgi:hypothetical protein
MVLIQLSKGLYQVTSQLPFRRFLTVSPETVILQPYGLSFGIHLQPRKEDPS